MKKLFPLFLLLFTSLTKAQIPPPIKVFFEGNNVQIGINLSCPWDGLSMSAIPNIIINQTNNHFDIIMSLPYNDPSIICSPLPPHVIDQVRFYFDLGVLVPGEYTITTNYVGNDESLPPQPEVEVFEFDQTSFFVAHPVPATNKTVMIIMIVLFGFAALIYFRRVREFN